MFKTKNKVDRFIARNFYEKDHVLFTRRTWESQQDTKKLRGNRWLIVPIDPDVHDEKHEAVSTVPLLDHFTARRVRAIFEPVPNDYIASVESLLFAIEEATLSPKAQEVERRLGELTIFAVEIQLPYLRKGLIPEDQR